MEKLSSKYTFFLFFLFVLLRDCEDCYCRSTMTDDVLNASDARLLGLLRLPLLTLPAWDDTDDRCWQQACSCASIKCPWRVNSFCKYDAVSVAVITLLPPCWSLLVVVVARCGGRSIRFFWSLLLLLIYLLLPAVAVDCRLSLSTVTVIRRTKSYHSSCCLCLYYSHNGSGTRYTAHGTLCMDFCCHHDWFMFHVSGFVLVVVLLNNSSTQHYCTVFTVK